MTPVFENDLMGRLSIQGTGSPSIPSIARTKTVELGQYEVVFAVTDEDRVVSVVEVRVKKDFRNIQQKLGSTGYIDVDQYLK
ncbi:MAG TPA: hypothetical protein VGJ06_03080 [Candidatus Acidoferrum sp.]|jgi:hypothetical protein